MKRISLYFLFFIPVFLFFSCKKEEQIAIELLNGRWSEANDDPNLILDGSITYAFNPDNTCVKVIYNALSNSDTTINWTYVISNDKTLITMYREDKVYTEQYTITKLTNKEMKWVNASPGDGNSDKRLVRY